MAAARAAPARRRWVSVVAFLALSGAQLISLNGCTAGSAPKLTISVEPSEAGKVVYLAEAAPTKDKPLTARLFLQLAITNGEATTITLDKLSLLFNNSQPGIVTRPIHWLQKDGTYTPVKIDPGKTQLWWFQKPGDEVILPAPAPTSVTLAISVEGFHFAAVATRPLAAHRAPTPEGSFLFPAHASDLRATEYWQTHGDTHEMSGNGSQSFAYDFGVIGLDPQSGQLSPFLPRPDGTKSDGTRNSDYRIWNKPIYAVADGTVLEAVDNVPTNPVPSDLKSTEKYWAVGCDANYNHCIYPTAGAGNHFFIQHGDEVVLYAHMQPGTLPTNLLTNGATVKAGQFLGLAGNSGNSSAPHLHMQANEGMPPAGPIRPMVFRDIYAVDSSTLKPPDPSGPWFHLTAHGLPHVDAAIWPAATPPAWVPPGWQEVAFHGVAEAQYQAKFDQVTGSGYRPVWVDGYDVAGQTYFNAIFRPDDGTPWVARSGLSAADYQTEFDTWTKQQGYRPLQVESYLSGDAVRYAAIFVKTPGPAFTAYHGKSAAEHQQLFDTLTKQQGYVAVNISAVVIAGARTYTALYEKRDVGSWDSGDFLTLVDYQSTFDANAKAGLHLVYLNAYTYLGSPRIVAIWYQKAPSGVARHNMTADEYQQEHDKEVSAGVLTRAVTGYENNGQPTFAALWTP
jgi:hypothetical protein